MNVNCLIWENKLQKKQKSSNFTNDVYKEIKKMYKNNLEKFIPTTANFFYKTEYICRKT